VSEDEAFIRTIVDGPGDDTPRLVYADWLDDRADRTCARNTNGRAPAASHVCTNSLLPSTRYGWRV